MERNSGVDGNDLVGSTIRGRLDVEVGALVQKGDTVYRIAMLVDFETVIGKAVETGRPMSLLIRDLQPLPSKLEIPHHTNNDIEAISDADWKILRKRLEAIQPLIELGTPGRPIVEARAKEIGVHAATLYRWLQRYNSMQISSMLAPLKRGWTRGKHRINPEVEDVISAAIEHLYLTKQRLRPASVVEEVAIRCARQNLKPPSPSTIVSRIDAIPERERLRRRGFKELAKKKFQPVPGKFPDGRFPLDVIQIDHTPLDIELVDDIYRRPIGRPWLTLAIDVYSRMVAGYYLSFDSPSVTSVAMCIAHSIIPKDQWLLAHGIDAEWPVWGFPTKVHFDNGPEFRAGDIQNACVQHNIQVVYRPVKVPRYGAHIERLLGTFARRIHEIPGTTFSSVSERQDYDSAKNAVLTKLELETWFIREVCGRYHVDKHSGIGMSPTRQWNIGIFGNGNDMPGRGLPALPINPWALQCDFLPAYRRTVQPTGVEIDIGYYAEALRPYIGAAHPMTGKKTRFIFRRDPRDISSLLFFDPELKQYFKIPAADLSFPATSIWEFRRAKKKLREEGAASVDSRSIARTIQQQRELLDDAAEKTRKARRESQRRREHERKVTPAQPRPVQGAPAPIDQTEVSAGFVEGDVDAYDDIA